MTFQQVKVEVNVEVKHEVKKEQVEGGFDFEAPKTIGFEATAAESDDHLGPYAIDLRPAVFITGILHVVHNVVESMSHVLEYWDRFVLRLTHITRLLHNPFFRERMLQTCFSNEPLFAFRNQFRKFPSNAKVFVGRWGSALAAVSGVLPVQTPLQAGWDLSKYKLAGTREQHETAGGSIRLNIVDLGITGPMFWAYARMVDRLGEALNKLALWSEQCPCHSDSCELQGADRHRVSGLRARVGMDVCPMSTRRAPEAAAGALNALVAKVWRIVNSEIAIDPATLRCKPEDRVLLLADLARARSHIQYAFTAKLAHWQQLPHILFGLGHADPEQARECGRRALRLVAGSGDTACHHWVTTFRCMPGGTAHDQLLQFIAGRDLASLVLLAKCANRCEFAPISERWIEAQHSLVKRSLYGRPHASAVHVAYVGVQKALRKHMMENPGFLPELAKCVHTVRTPQLALQGSGLWLHPMVQKLLSAEPLPAALDRQYRPRVVEVLYHVDGDSLFQDLADFHESPQAPPAPPELPAPSVSAASSSHAPPQHPGGGTPRGQKSSGLTS